MKRFIFITLLLLTFCSLFFPTIVSAQSNLLPEKNQSVSESINTSTSNDVVTNNTSSGEEKDTLAWAAVIIAIMLFGMFLLALEIAVIPGFGVAGVSGIILIVLALALSFWKLSNTMAIAVTVISLVGVIILIWFLVSVLPNTRFFKKFTLSENSIPDNSEYDVDPLSKYIGLEGVAVSNLRPSGMIKILDERIDIVSDGTFIEKGTKVKVIKTGSGKIVARTLEE
jgi:membrane-bound serine protease (ClpP class)